MAANINNLLAFPDKGYEKDEKEEVKDVEKEATPYIAGINEIAERLLGSRLDKEILGKRMVVEVEGFLSKTSVEDYNQLKKIKNNLLKNIPRDIQKYGLQVDEIQGVISAIDQRLRSFREKPVKKVTILDKFKKERK